MLRIHNEVKIYKSVHNAFANPASIGVAGGWWRGRAILLRRLARSHY
jgi:hypothetical protein